ncbi:pentatricopeptide repeat-containing protein At1g62680, mitochondrial-like [Arachis ipaensis]|uniref:pentatricopeptide repeat-containing protein At1g62680, mitochondrial-like n=1 Tax=Arachis ipaensis TaxID=130454 RepID=UPI000A2B7744|nr:pentatricopeptide repeat-containing protein At1g62680, mitochondrial-like [Arachis ipaensis]
MNDNYKLLLDFSMIHAPLLLLLTLSALYSATVVASLPPTRDVAAALPQSYAHCVLVDLKFNRAVRNEIRIIRLEELTFGRCAFQIPKLSPYSVPHSALRLCFPSTSSLHSHSHPQSLDEAVDSFTRMLSMRPPPSIIQFNKILGSLAKTNHFLTTISLFQQLQARGIAPDLSLSLSGKVEKALHFHDRVLLAHGFHFDQVTYGTLINGFCKTGHTSAAIQALRKIPRYGIAPDVFMYNAIIDSLCKVTLVSDAFHLYSEMLAKGISPDVITYNTLTYGLCLAGQPL